ncbi:hypothetical protein [Pseudomonas sp. ES3]|uniref:hypothetical protein n=1 Tax=Pseudomonas sp. ES3 TaxID=3424776 RepID=UPI003D33CA08
MEKRRVTLPEGQVLCGFSVNFFRLLDRQLLADSVEKVGLGSAAEKYASEIEIFTFGRGFQTQISRSSVQKRRFHWSMTGQFWMTDFFQQNRSEAVTGQSTAG